MTEAVLLVGGKGTRLRPLTVDTPKPMLPTAGVPFLHHQLAQAARRRRRPRRARDVVPARGLPRTGSATASALGLRIDYVTEDEPLGTGGGIRNVARPARERAGRPGRHPQRRHPVRPRPGRAGRGAPSPRRRRDACT